MDAFAEPGLFSSFMLCRRLPESAIGPRTAVWPPLQLSVDGRTRNDTRDRFTSVGHRPNTYSEVSQNNFRLRKWVEYTGRRSGPSMVQLSSPNALSSALSVAGSYITTRIRNGIGGGVSIRMPEDITTYATLPEHCYTPTPEKPWQGIWCGDYSGHGCEFLVIQQPNKEDERPLPSGMDWLQQWFRGDRRGSSSSSGSRASGQEEGDSDEPATAGPSNSALYEVTADGEVVFRELGEASSYPARTPQQNTSDYQDEL